MDIKLGGKIYRVLFIKRFLPCSFERIIPQFTRMKSFGTKGKSLQGKVVMVTGGASGIGYSIACCLLREGAKVILCGRNEKKLQDAINNIIRSTNYSENLKYLVWDVSDVLKCEENFSIAEQFWGPINVLINNAGVTSHLKKRCTFENMDKENIHYVHDINVIGTVEMCNEYIRRNKSGNILNIVSNTSVRSAKDAYFTSKWALKSFTIKLSEQIAKEGLNFTVNGISPGAIRSNMTRVDSIFWKISKNERIGLPEEIGEMAIMVLKSSFMGMNGKIYLCDGGEVLF